MSEKVNNMADVNQTVPCSSHASAEKETTQRLLNAYLREMAMGIPTLAEDHPFLEELQQSDKYDPAQNHYWFLLDLPKTKAYLIGTLSYISPMGHHQYGETLFIRKWNDLNWKEVNSALEVASLLLEELEDQKGTPTTRKQFMLDQIQNSIEKTAFFIHAYEQKSTENEKQPDNWTMREMEQKLLYGHPFHPTPKSSEGFTTVDLYRYAPECQAEFPLHYWLVDKEWICEEWLDEKQNVESLLFPEVVEQLKEADSVRLERFRLLPLHPWQAQYLAGRAEIKRWLDEKKVIDLGQIGPIYFPTSSVRTVTSETATFSLKLPLHVRITHFIRENTPEQIRRSIDASRVLYHVRQKWQTPGFDVLIELGYRSLLCSDSESGLRSSLGVLFREHDLFQGKQPYVVASLLECAPGKTKPPIMQLIQTSGAAIEEWLDQYWQISLLPLLRLWSEKGISLEAHVQNSLLHVENGWPVHFYVRDMEGVSISRDRIAQPSVQPDSPVLYREEEAWSRWQYYILTNHFAHLISTIAFYGKISERDLWKRMQRQLETWAITHPSIGEYVKKLGKEKFLPAKANLISKFHDRGETPDYVSINNPLWLGKE